MCLPRIGMRLIHLLQEDTFADERLLMMPEATGALLVLFCRNHNVSDRRSLQFYHAFRHLLLTHVVVHRAPYPAHK